MGSLDDATWPALGNLGGLFSCSFRRPVDFFVFISPRVRLFISPWPFDFSEGPRSLDQVERPQRLATPAGGQS